MNFTFLIATSPQQEHLADYMAWQLKDYPLVCLEADSWWDKPQLILDLPHDKVIWLDNDIQIVDKKFFQIIDSPGLAAAYDPIARNYNTGVIVVEDRTPIKWWKDNLDRSLHGDQDSFPTPTVVLHSCYNSLRLARATPEYAVHYTGPVGKSQLVNTPSYAARIF